MPVVDSSPTSIPKHREPYLSDPLLQPHAEADSAMEALFSEHLGKASSIWNLLMYKQTTQVHSEANKCFKERTYLHLDSKVAWNNYLDDLEVNLPIVEAIEKRLTELHKEGNELVKPFYELGLFRAEATKKDLKEVGRNVGEVPEKLKVTIERIQTMEPHKVIAYSLVNHLAPIYGGQNMRERFTEYEGDNLWNKVLELYTYYDSEGKVLDSEAIGKIKEACESEVNNLGAKLEKKGIREFIQAAREAFYIRKSLVESLKVVPPVAKEEKSEATEEDASKCPFAAKAVPAVDKGKSKTRELHKQCPRLNCAAVAGGAIGSALVLFAALAVQYIARTRELT